MRLTVLGGDGGWPRPGGACSGYLLEHDGYRLLLDPGYATMPLLTKRVRATDVDAVLVTHGHPDHCADLSPLLRARAFAIPAAPALPVHAPAGALDGVLALDRPGVLDDAVTVDDLADGDRLDLGPYAVTALALPHTWPNLGYRITAAGRTLAYTGDSGPGERVVELARDATVLLAEASHPDRVPDDMAGLLSTARDAGAAAARAGVGLLLLTHLLPGTDPDDALRTARAAFPGAIEVARPGLELDLD